jgi:hypothetical protein
MRSRHHLRLSIRRTPITVKGVSWPGGGGRASAPREPVSQRGVRQPFDALGVAVVRDVRPFGGRRELHTIVR